MHLGLVGGIGPASTEFYYRSLVASHKAAGAILDLTIVNEDINTLVDNMRAGENVAQAERYAKFIGRLKAAGADVAAITSLGGHFCYDELKLISPLPITSMMDDLDKYFKRNGLKTVGLLGTKVVMETHLYGGVESVDCIVPDGDLLLEVDRRYLEMASAGVCSDELRDFFFEIGRNLISAGAEVVVLAGTDLCLAFDGHDVEFPVVDAAAIHVQALTDLSLGRTNG